MLSLRKALRATNTSRIAFTGAGGKTTAVFRLARELHATCPRVLVTTTTHFAESQARLADHHIRISGPVGLPADLPEGVIVFTSGEAVGGRLAGPAPEVVQVLGELASAEAVPLIIEADGARMRPVKAPAAHEPVLPEFLDMVVSTVGLSAIGKPLGPDVAHRPERYAELSRATPGAPLSPGALAAVLRHPEGGLKGVRPGVRKIALLNQADTDLLQAAAGRLATDLLEDFDSVLVAALQQELVFSAREPIAGIVLAAGGSTRMGAPKQLLDWQGRPLVVHAAENALAAGCSPVVIVTGAEESRVRGAVSHLPVHIAHNTNWEAGQSTSVQAGLASLPQRTGAALFLLADQPFAGAELFRALMEAHARSLNPIIAPLIDEQRGNPVLFDRSTFADFAEIRGDRGGRQLFSKYRTEWVPWHDPRALLDLDTMADYDNLNA